MPSKNDRVKLIGNKGPGDDIDDFQVDIESNHVHGGDTRGASTRGKNEGEIGVTTFDIGDAKVYETKEVVQEGEKKKVTYTRKISVHDKKDEKHCHSNVPITPQDKKSRNKLIIASILCLFFMTVEIVGGFLAGSLAIISDAAHLLTDFASFMISLVAIYLASRPATQRFNYGWHRTEILGAFASIILLWILTGVLAYEAVMRVVDTDYTIDSKIMLITAGIGVAFNIVLATTLHQHGHSHGGGGHGHSHGGGGGHGHSHGGGGGHGHSHGDEGGHANGHSHGDQGHSHGDLDHSHGDQSDIRNNAEDHGLVNNHVGGREYGSIIKEDKQNVMTHMEISIEDCDSKGKGKGQKKEKNINVKAAFVHVVGDLLQSFGVLVAAFIIYYKPEWKIADPICTFFFSIIVLVTTASIMRDIVVVLMEGKPRSINFSDVRQTLLSVDKVKDTHNLRMWSLTMDKVALSVHLVVEDECDAHEILRNASMAVRSHYNIIDMTIQIEEYVEEMDNCNQCVGPS